MRLSPQAVGVFAFCRQRLQGGDDHRLVSGIGDVLIPLDENDGAVISLLEYAEAAEKAFKRVEEWRKENYGKIEKKS